MSLSITSAFDAGNIRVLKIQDDAADLEIVKDHGSNFHQWFYFRVASSPGRQVTLRILNCRDSAYPDGWSGYSACVSEDRQLWRRTDTSYEDGVLTIRHTPRQGNCWIAYFAPYSLERHYDLIANAGAQPGVRTETLGKTLDGRDIDLITLGEGPRRIWLIARQHPGESMTEWWMEGAIGRLLDPADPIARTLRSKATFYIVPNMNPDGSFRGHLRTNAAGVNLNREWSNPSPERSPEVYYVLKRMKETGVDFAIDVHGDEAIPYVFIAGFEGIPNWTDAQGARLNNYVRTLARLTPDFQTTYGYPKAAPGKANLSMATNQLANRFGCVAMTLEMPFKDNADMPDAGYGWSTARSKALARHCLAALYETINDLR